MCDIRNPSIIEALQKSAQHFGLKSLAPLLDKRPSTLYGELSPYAEPGKSKLGLDDALEIMRLTGDHTALVLIAAAFGYRLEAAHVCPDHTDVRDECLDDAQKLADFHRLARDPEVPPPALRKVAQLVHNDVEETCEAHRRWWEERKG